MTYHSNTNSNNTNSNNTNSNNTNSNNTNSNNTLQNIECLTLNTIVNVVSSSGNKYVFNGLTNYDTNKFFGLGIGNYVFQDISSLHPMALLNNDVSNLISYSGDSSKKLEERVGDISYDFYHGDINVSVNGDFSGLSVYCYYHNYMGGENLLKYSETCHKTSTIIQPSNALKCLSQKSRVNIITFNENINKYVFNNELAYDPTIRYGLYDGTYILQNIPQSHPLAILNYDFSDVLTYSGDSTKKDISSIDDISYDFYYGDISINVLGSFGTAGIACYNHENMRMDYIFSYSIFCNPQAIITSPPENSYEFDNSNIIVSQTNSSAEKNYFINYNNTKRPWKVNTSYISHYNEIYANESLKQKDDNNKEYNFKIDSSKNNLRIESVDSNIDLFTHTTEDGVIHYINLEGKTNFNNNSYFNETSIFKENVISEKTITTQNLVASDISVSVLRISDNITANIIGNIKIDGTLDVIGQIKDEDGNVVQGNLLNNYTIQNSKLNDSSLNNIIINNSSIGITNPSQAIFTDVSINNLAIENDLIINNNLKLKNIEENGYIYATLNSNTTTNSGVYRIHNNNRQDNHVLFYISNSDLEFEASNTNNEPNDNGRNLDEDSFKYRFYLEKNNIYYFNFFDNYLETLVNFRDRAIGLYFNNESNIDIKYLDNASVDNKTINTKKYYIIYHRDFSNNYGNNKDSISLNIKGNFDFCDLVLLDTTNTTTFSILKTFEKVFLYKHDFNLLDKIETLDNSINTFLTPTYDANFNNLNINSDTSLNQKLFVGSDVSLNSNLFVQDDVSLNSKLFVQDDVSFNSKLFVRDDVSLNSKLFVQDDVSFNSKLFVQDDVSLNSNLFVASDVSLNSKLFVQNDVSLNSKLFVQNDVSFNSNVNVSNNITIDGSANLNYIDVSDGYIYNTIIGYDSTDNLNPLSGQKANFSTTNTNDLIVRNSINFYDSSGLTFDSSILNTINKMKLALDKLDPSWNN